MKNHNHYSFRTIYCADIKQIIECLNSVVGTLKHRDLFIAPSQEYIETIIRGYGIMAGAFLGDRLIAFASIVFPHKGKNNLGHLLNFNSEKLLSVVQLEHFCVSPDFQGRGLAKKLIDFLLAELAPQYTILLSTVSPKNQKSLTIAFKERQQIVLFANIYGVDRYLMCRNLMDYSTDMQISELELTVDNIEEIRHALNNGYVGVAFGAAKASILFIKGGEYNETISDKY